MIYVFFCALMSCFIGRTRLPVINKLQTQSHSAEQLSRQQISINFIKHKLLLRPKSDENLNIHIRLTSQSMPTMAYLPETKEIQPAVQM
jgi:hypothetical protein